MNFLQLAHLLLHFLVVGDAALVLEEFGEQVVGWVRGGRGWEELGFWDGGGRAGREHWLL